MSDVELSESDGDYVERKRPTKPKRKKPDADAAAKAPKVKRKKPKLNLTNDDGDKKVAAVPAVPLPPSAQRLLDSAEEVINNFINGPSSSSSSSSSAPAAAAAAKPQRAKKAAAATQPSADLVRVDAMLAAFRASIAQGMTAQLEVDSTGQVRFTADTPPAPVVWSKGPPSPPPGIAFK